MAAAAISGYIDTATQLTMNGLSLVFGNEKVNEVATQIAEFVKYNWEVIFATVALLSFVASPAAFAVGLAVGYWAYDKTFIVLPGEAAITPSSLFSSPKNQLTSLSVTVASRFLIAGPVSSLAAGFLAGCVIRKMLVGDVAPAAYRPPVAAAH
jgi:hypothetical protein